MSDQERVDPPIYRAPWYSPLSTHPFDSDPEFGRDDPEALRAAGPQAVATALAGLADQGRMMWRRDQREVSALILQWIDNDGGEFDDLLVDIGFRPKRGLSFVYLKKLAERDALLREIIALPRWGNLPAGMAAKQIREEFEGYEINGAWAVDKNLKGRPQGEPRAQFWRILKLALHHPLPNIQKITAMVAASRA